MVVGMQADIEAAAVGGLIPQSETEAFTCRTRGLAAVLQLGSVLPGGRVARDLAELRMDYARLVTYALAMLDLFGPESVEAYAGLRVESAALRLLAAAALDTPNTASHYSAWDLRWLQHAVRLVDHAPSPALHERVLKIVASGVPRPVELSDSL